MKAQDLMTRVVQTVTPRNTLDDAAQLLFEHDCGMVPVVDDGPHVKAVLTDRDICIVAHNRKRPLSELSVESAMSAKVYSCKADDEAEAILKMMGERRVRRLPVLDPEGLLLGVVSVDDLAVAAVEGQVDAAQLAKTLATIRGAGAN